MNISKFLKLFGFPTIIFAGLIFFAGYMAWRECTLKSTLTKEALQGNQYAIAIMTKCHKPWTMDERVVYEAINGNMYALEILGIKNQQIK
ncbi:MAG: hypothetical protein ABSA17_07690 [Rhabdochlamydiaceae bacterium]|jgi:hypothetical protein